MASPLRRGLLWAAYTLSLVLVAAGLYQFRTVQLDQVARQEAANRTAADEQALARLRQTAERLQREDANRRAAELAAAKAAAGPTAPADPKAAAQARREAAQAKARAFFARYPQAKALWIAFMTANMDNYYGPFFRKAGLTQAQIDAFVAKTAELHADTAQIDPQGRISIGQQNLSETDARAILGDAAYQQWQDTIRALPAQGFTAGLAISETNGSTPLSAGQVDAITQAVVDNSPDYANGNRVNPRNVDWSSVLPAVQETMTPAQWQQAQAFLIFQRANQQLQALMRGGGK